MPPARRTVVDLGDADWYRLPAWYDVLHGAGTAGEVDGLEAIASRYCRCSWRGAMRWLEPACGTGRCLLHAARRGTRVHGFDALPEMIDYARARFRRAHLDAQLDVASFADFPLPHRPAHFAFCLINSLRHVRTDDELDAHLARMSAALAPGGVYAVGLNVSAPGTETPTEDIWSGARGTCRVTQLVQYLPPAQGSRTETVVSHLTVITPKREVHVDTQYRLRTWSGAQWRSALARSPLSPVAIVDESGRHLADPDDPAWSGPDASRYGVWLLTRA